MADNEEPLLGTTTDYVAMGEEGELSDQLHGLEQVDEAVANELGTLRHRKWSTSNHKTRDISQGDITEKEADSFFAWGRDFEGLHTPHKFLSSEKKAMAKYHSNNYFAQNSEVYRADLQRKEAAGKVEYSMQRWIAMGLIGFIVALISVVVRQTVDVISTRKYELIEPLIDEQKWGTAWAVSISYSCAFVGFGALLVLFVAPAAALSGIPEVIAFLNGVHVPAIFNIKTLVVKLIGVICSVGSGLPVGPEGPMIHMGGMVGAGVSQGRSASLGFESGFFSDFRNVKDRRDFITGGVACGVSAAFGSPVGGLLFAMEEVASFWSLRLGWSIFFGCMIAVFVSDVFNSALEGWEYLGNFGAFDDKNSILYKVTYDVSLHVAAVVPAVLCGILGGILGTAFTVFNLKVARMRKQNIAPTKWKRFTEVIVIMVVYGSISLFLPAAFDCTTVTDCSYVDFDSQLPAERPDEGTFFYRCGGSGSNGGYNNIPSDVKAFTCDGVIENDMPPGTPANLQTYTISYNQMATLITTTGEDTIHKLFTRGTDQLFSYGTLVAMLVIYFIAACYTMGSVVAAGVVVPMLLIGGCYGRIVGKVCVDIAGGAFPKDTIWSWVDPGVFALIGAGSFFGGVSRLTLSLTVIMIEISNDIHMLLIMMSTIMVAKWIADYYTHSLYHALIELKTIPFINDEIPSHSFMDRFQVKEIMQSPVRTITEVSKVDDIRELFETTHQAFPVVRATPDGPVVVGMILKETLLELLRYHDIFFKPGENRPTARVAYSKISDTEVSQRFKKRHIENDVASASSRNPYLDFVSPEDGGLLAEESYELEKLLEQRGDGLLLDIAPYMDESAFTVRQEASVKRAYLLFRTMGLRHLPIVDELNRPIGMLTRKDLQGHDVAHALEHHEHH